MKITQTPGKDEFTWTGLQELDLMNLKEGLQLSRERYEASIQRHRILCTPTMCRLDGREGRTCAEDLMFLYSQLELISATIYTLEGTGI